jgi:hypothetical protein
MAITSCTVTGNVKTPDNSGLQGVLVKAYMIHPVEYADGTLVAPYQVSTETDSNGDWSLTLVETTTVSATMTVAFEFPSGGADYKRKEYTVTVPNSASATFASLIS